MNKSMAEPINLVENERDNILSGVRHQHESRTSQQYLSFSQGIPSKKLLN